MSKYGLQIADKSVFGIKTPDKALELIEMVISQYFGEYWTQHKPRCPLCNNTLSDTEKYMNRPVGECTNPKCDSTIHIADFMGKIRDVLDEWALAKDDWKEETIKELKKKVKVSSETNMFMKPKTPAFADSDVELIDEKTVFVW